MADQIDDIQAKLAWHWRDTMRTIRFVNFDARVSFLIPVWLVYLRTSTIILTVIVFYVFNMLEKKGLTFPAALRALRVWMIGNERSAKIGRLGKHKFNDYG